MSQFFGCIIFLFSVIGSSTAFAGELTFSTYYPAPHGAYDLLHMLPRTAQDSTDCLLAKVGTMYVNKENYNSFQFCQDLGGGNFEWGPLSTHWVKNGADIYPIDSNAFAGVGIDPLTDLPIESRLTIIGSGDDDTTSSLNVLDANGRSLFYIADNGSVGIGTDSPTDTFEVIADGGYFDLSSYQGAIRYP